MCSVSCRDEQTCFCSHPVTRSKPFMLLVLLILDLDMQCYLLYRAARAKDGMHLFSRKFTFECCMSLIEVFCDLLQLVVDNLASGFEECKEPSRKYDPH